MKKTLKKGFTLTELIVVIVIIGILAAVLIPSLTGYINKSRESAALQEATGVVDVIESFKMEKDADSIDKNMVFGDYYRDITGSALAAGYYVNKEATSVETATHLYYQTGSTVIEIRIANKVSQSLPSLPENAVELGALK